MDALFTAFDVTGLNTNVTTILIAGVTLTLLFTGYKFLKRGARVM